MCLAEEFSCGFTGGRAAAFLYLRSMRAAGVTLPRVEASASTSPATIGARRPASRPVTERTSSRAWSLLSGAVVRRLGTGWATGADHEAVNRRAFGSTLDADDIERRGAILDPDRFRVATDDGAMVGVAGSFAKQLTLPGGTTVAVVGLS